MNEHKDQAQRPNQDEPEMQHYRRLLHPVEDHSHAVGGSDDAQERASRAARAMVEYLRRRRSSESEDD